MNGLKNRPVIRTLIIAVCFVAAVIIVIDGWKWTGKMSGLVEMTVGLGVLLTALAIYNHPFKEPKRKDLKKR